MEGLPFLRILYLRVKVTELKQAENLWFLKLRCIELVVLPLQVPCFSTELG